MFTSIRMICLNCKVSDNLRIMSNLRVIFFPRYIEHQFFPDRIAEVDFVTMSLDSPPTETSAVFGRTEQRPQPDGWQ